MKGMKEQVVKELRDLAIVVIAATRRWFMSSGLARGLHRQRVGHVADSLAAIDTSIDDLSNWLWQHAPGRNRDLPPTPVCPSRSIAQGWAPFGRGRYM